MLHGGFVRVVGELRRETHTGDPHVKLYLRERLDGVTKRVERVQDPGPVDLGQKRLRFLQGVDGLPKLGVGVS